MPEHYKRKAGPSQQFKYLPEALEKAISEVKRQKGSVRRIAEKYNVPKSTLSEKVRGVRKLLHGGQQALDHTTENLLVGGLLKAAEWGFPLKSSDVKDIVKNHIEKQGPARRKPIFKNNRPGWSWMTRFLKRHPVLTVRLSENIKRARAQIDKKTLDDYFDKLEISLQGIPPSNIINYDETNCKDDPEKQHVIVKRGARHAERIIDTSKQSTSVMFATAADGTLLPPFVVYKATYVYETWTENGPEGAIYRSTPSGWFDMNTYEEWFMKIALPYLRRREGRRALLGDNLASHLSYEVIQKCQEYDIQFILLPPNSTHLTQPNDVAFFGPFKKSFKACLLKWKQKNRGVLPKCQFPKILKESIENMPNLAENIKAGFRACGIVPLNRQEVLKRLPGSSRQSEENSSPITDSLVEILKDMRSQETKKIPRGKKIPISPGESVTLEKLPVPSNTPKSSRNAGKKQTRGNTKRQKSPVEEAIDILESDEDVPSSEESSNSADEDSPESAQEEPNSETPTEEIKETDFLLVKFKTAEDNGTRFYVGRLVDIDKSKGEYEVDFLRKKSHNQSRALRLPPSA